MPRIRDAHGTTQRDRAYDLLCRALAAQKIPSGQRLREMEWAQRLNVNRFAVREACGRLCGEGLLVEGTSGGYFVPQLSPEDIEDVLEVRILLEAGAIERICRLCLNEPNNLQPLQKACDDLEWLLRNGYRAEVAESDRRFHQALVAIAGSRRLVQIFRYVASIEPELAIGGRPECEMPGRAMLRDHRVILAAIRKGRAPEAQGVLRRHLMAGRSTAAPASASRVCTAAHAACAGGIER